MASFDELISANKRNTVFLIMAVTAVLCVVATAVGVMAMAWRMPVGAGPDDVHGGVPPLWRTAAIASGAALVVALVLTLFTYYGGSATILAISRAREISLSLIHI